MVPKTNIIIIGLANSGSSAVQDLLTEYRNVGRFRYEESNFITGELNHFRLRGMIADQLYPNVNLKQNFLLPEYFKTHKRPRVPIKVFLRTIISDKIYFTVKPKGFSKLSARNRIHQIKNQQKYYDLLKEVTCKIQNEPDVNKRILIAKGWLMNVNEIFANNKPYIIHKPIFHESHLDIWPEIFEPCKVIVTIRDPKDQVSTMLKTSPVFNDLPWRFDALFGRDNGLRPLKTFIDTTYMRMIKIDEMEKIFGPSKFLMIDFEGLVNKYEAYKAKIENFLGLKEEDHLEKYKYFNPNISRLTINKYSEELTSQEKEIISLLYEWYDEKIQRIKTHL